MWPLCLKVVITKVYLSHFFRHISCVIISLNELNSQWCHIGKPIFFHRPCLYADEMLRFPMHNHTLPPK
uniref:Uncharacterized protein n=1 Tax=Anguilla anguilla TaxID=7936 RepID=A0A0E9WU21_ANGAN